ncbi:MAG: hypothetical protein ACI8Z5_001474 [Lentimonas sp.]|jgi:hypothetical protein
MTVPHKTYRPKTLQFGELLPDLFEGHDPQVQQGLFLNIFLYSAQ